MVTRVTVRWYEVWQDGFIICSKLGHFQQWTFAQKLPWKDKKLYQTMEFFSRRKWTTGAVQHSNMDEIMLGMCCKFFFGLSKNTTAYHLDQYSLLLLLLESSMVAYFEVKHVTIAVFCTMDWSTLAKNLAWKCRYIIKKILLNFYHHPWRSSVAGDEQLYRPHSESI